MKNIFFKFGIFTIMFVSFLSCNSPNNIDSVKLALDWYPNANHMGIYLAIENGYFLDENIDVEIYTPSDPSTVLQTVASGADDFGINYQPDLLIARNEGVPVVSILGMVQHPLNSVMSLKSKGYESPLDLKGKKIGYPGIPWNENALNTMLEFSGLHGITDVEIVNVGWELGSSLISENVDAIIGAYFTHESFILENEGYPVNIMRMEEWGVPDYYELVLVTSEDFLNNNPSIVKRFTRALIQGYQDAIDDPQKGIDVLILHAPEAKKNERIERLGGDILKDLWQDGEGKFGTQEKNKWMNFALWMQEKGIIDESLDVIDAYTDIYSLK
jgi:putative hydroxymethylpyrimidine transport system substrate-binding protein